MDRMKTKFIIAVTTRLAAAEDSNAKTDLIEELSENLYQRYLDLVAAGEMEDTAYTKALEDLGCWPIWVALAPTGSCPVRRARGGTISMSFSAVRRRWFVRPSLRPRRRWTRPRSSFGTWQRS